MPRYLSSLAAALFMATPGWAQAPAGSPPEQPAELHRCGTQITGLCLEGEIEASLDAGTDPFRRERILLALAQAQLANGNAEKALASYEQLTADTAKAEFLIAHAKRLIATNDNASALERLREADALLSDGQGDLGRLNATRQSQLVAEMFAQAGAAAEGFAILEDIAGYRNRVPMNPMLLALLLQIGKTQADIGYSEEAAAMLAETYELALDQGMEVMPEQALAIFETWASLDADAAKAGAEELAGIVGEDGPSAFEFAIWTGLVSGMATSGEDKSELFERARASLDDAPERAAALLLVPRLAGALRAADQPEEARALLDRAREEALALASPVEKATVLLALAEGFAESDAAEEAAEILNELRETTADGGPDGMVLRHITSSIPAQLAILGRTDEAYDLAVTMDGGRKEMALIMAADKLATRGNYGEAMRFLREVEGEIAVMMMAGIADRLADTSNPTPAE